MGGPRGTSSPQARLPRLQGKRVQIAGLGKTSFRQDALKGPPPSERMVVGFLDSLPNFQLNYPNCRRKLALRCCQPDIPLLLLPLSSLLRTCCRDCHLSYEFCRRIQPRGNRSQENRRSGDQYPPLHHLLLWHNWYLDLPHALLTAQTHNLRRYFSKSRRYGNWKTSHLPTPVCLHSNSV